MCSDATLVFGATCKGVQGCSWYGLCLWGELASAPVWPAERVWFVERHTLAVECGVWFVCRTCVGNPNTTWMLLGCD